MFGYMFTYSLVSTYLMSLQFMIENLCIINSKSVKAVTVFSAPDEKCLHTVASSWTFLLTLIHDARNHELKKNPNYTSVNENYVVPCICLRAI